MITNVQYSYLGKIQLFIIAMKNSTAIEPTPTLKESIEGRERRPQDSKISYSKGYIRINKHIIWFSSLPPQTRHVFTCSLKQCVAKHCMKSVFCQWKIQDDMPSRGRMLHLSQEEAISLIWRMQRCLQRQKITQRDRHIQQEIRILKNKYDSYQKSQDNIKRKQGELQQLNLSSACNGEKQQLAKRMRQFKQEMEQQMRELDQKINERQLQQSNIQQQLKYTLDAPEISQILTKAISKQIRNLLRQSIIGIVEQTHEIVRKGQPDLQQVYVIFEQAYETKKIKKRAIVRLLGSEVYLQKVDKFNAFMENMKGLSPEERREQDQILCCHRCLKIQGKSKLKRCKTSIRPAQTNSYPSTDYFSYRKLHLEGDYFYEPQQQHILPYFLYSKNSKNQLACNRAFCQECLLVLWGENKNRPGCPYCKGLCGCSRCSIAYGIVKLIALDYQNDINLQKTYHEHLKLFGGIPHKAVSQSLPIRQENTDISEFVLLEHVWASNQQLRQVKAMQLKLTPSFIASLKASEFKPNLYEKQNLQYLSKDEELFDNISDEKSKSSNFCERVRRSKRIMHKIQYNMEYRVISQLKDILLI